MKTLVMLVKDDTEAAVDKNFNMNKVKGNWCDFARIVQKNGKWYIYTDFDDEYALLTVTKNGFTIKSTDNNGIARFTFDTKLQTLVEIDETGNIVKTFILKDYNKVNNTDRSLEK